MKIYRLGRDELTRWRQNTPHFVLPDGRVEGPLPPGLDPLIAGVVLRAKQQRRSLEVKVGHLGVVYSVAVEATITKTGLVNTAVTVDGRSIATGRDVLYDELFTQHGPLQVRAPNGVILKVVRDPGEERPTVADGQRLAPRPSACTCKDWGSPHPGVHHQTCPFNRFAPAEERAPTTAMGEAELAAVPAAALAPAPPPQTQTSSVTSTPVAATPVAEGPVSPEACPEECFAWPVGGGGTIAAGQHHPTCPHHLPWLQHQSRSRAAWLIDLRSAERVRRATLDELAESDVRRKRTGQPVIFIDDVPYAVVPESELAETA